MAYAMRSIVTSGPQLRVSDGTLPASRPHRDVRVCRPSGHPACRRGDHPPKEIGRAHKPAATAHACGERAITVLMPLTSMG
ncbi:hypothetical protein GCM10010412_033640 [Nonomuraea recticatena]|uniref:Uncharacterized protein n=1 Tax=Nonomuraea recticatena TaxID=46178 RepID=A0ABN3RU95_9ACTN